MPDQSGSKAGYIRGGTLLGARLYSFSRGGTSTTGAKAGFVQGNQAPISNKGAYAAGASGGTTASMQAYINGLTRNGLSAYTSGYEDPGGSPMATSYIWLRTSDGGATKSKKFRVISEGYDDGTPDKTISMEKTIGGGLDISQGAVYKSWSPVIRVRHTETETDYGTLADLEYFYSLNDPGGTPSNVITFIDHHEQSYTAMLVGEFRKQLLSAMIEGQYAWYLVRIRMMRVQ